MSKTWNLETAILGLPVEVSIDETCFTSKTYDGGFKGELLAVFEFYINLGYPFLLNIFIMIPYLLGVYFIEYILTLITFGNIVIVVIRGLMIYFALLYLSNINGRLKPHYESVNQNWKEWLTRLRKISKPFVLEFSEDRDKITRAIRQREFPLYQLKDVELRGMESENDFKSIILTTNENDRLYIGGSNGWFKSEFRKEIEEIAKELNELIKSNETKTHQSIFPNKKPRKEGINQRGQIRWIYKFIIIGFYISLLLLSIRFSFTMESVIQYDLPFANYLENLPMIVGRLIIIWTTLLNCFLLLKYTN